MNDLFGSKGFLRRFLPEAKLAASLICVFAVFECPGFANAQVQSNIIESFEVARDGGLLTIPVFIKDREYLFAIDTGSSTSIIDPALQRAFFWTNREVRLKGNTYSIWKNDEALVGSRRVPLVTRAICIDLAGLRDASNQNIWGILGMDFLRAHIVQFDFDAGRVSFLKTSEGVAGEKIQLEFNRVGLPTVAMSVSGLTPRPFLVDSGCVAGIEMGTLSTRIFDRLAESNKLSVHLSKSRYLTLNGPLEGRTGESIDQVLHLFRHVAPVYQEAEVDSIGLGFLSRFKVTFDFIGNVLYMERGKRFAANCPANRLGIDFVMDDGVPVFRDVVEDELAWRSGIHNGNRLLRINGKLSREMSIAEIGYFIASPAPGELRLGIVSPPAEAEREVVIANASAKASGDGAKDTAP